MKDDTIYLHVFKWPEEGKLQVPNVKASGAYLLGDMAHSPLAVEQTDQGIVISGPQTAPDSVATVVVLTP